MANSTSNIDMISVSQAFKEVVANSFFNAASPAALFAYHESASGGLIWAYYGGKFRKDDGSVVMLSNDQITLGASVTTYIEANSATGAVTQNLIGFTPGRIPLYTVITGSATITSYVDLRTSGLDITDGLASITIGGDYVAANSEAACRIIELSGSPGASFTLTLPARARRLSINNATGQSAVISVGTGGTVTIAAGKVAEIYTKAGGVVRVGPDT